MESSKRGEKKEKKYESIKVKVETREKLRDAAEGMDVGIGKAVEILVNARRDAITDKIGDLGEITGEIADVLLSSGMLDIKFKGSGIDDVSIEDDCVVIRGFIRAGISDKNAREEIYKVIKDGLERQT